ncbi:DUF5686 family protein [Rhodohalobacter sp. 8-1]|uniref:DUF5686 family protein n=1 Tax=Rhodohalobacter sp. 8-1 TaxID=3131972 RepID=UPI0030EBE163
MTLSRPLLLLIAFLFAISYQAAQGQTVNGIITDAKSGEPLPSATVLYEGTFRGTIANLEGEFSIDVDQFPATLLIRYIGYESEKLELTEQPADTLQVRLNPSVTELGEIVVTDQDPGLSIMERVIARKQLWRAELNTYEVDAFTRQVLKNDTSIVSITESGTRSFWDREQGHREIQLYRRQTTNIGADQNFAGVRFLPNFYDNNITVAGYEMVGITHPDALSYYDFRLVETTQIDGDPVYVINIIPARRLQPLFIGTAYVHGVDYALLEVNLKPNSVVSFPPPIKEFNLSYRQQYSNFDGNIWLPIDMRIDGTVRIEMVGLRFPAIKFNQTSRLSEYKVNVDLPDSLYEQEDVLTRVDADSMADFSRQMVPLTREEELAYESIDSTNTLEKAFKPEGFLSGLVMDDEDSQSVAMGLGSILPSGLELKGSFNRVDGFNAGFGYRNVINEIGLDASAYSSYSFHADFLNYGAGIRQKIPVKDSRTQIFLMGNYDNHITAIHSGSIYSSFMNGFQAVLGGVDYFDYFRQERYSAGIDVRRLLPLMDVSLSFVSGRDQSIQTGENTIYDYSLFGWHNIRRPNLPVTEGQINTMQLTLDLNRQNSTFGVSGSRQLRLSAERSVPALGSDVMFTKLSMSANWNMETFFRRRVFANTLDLKFSAGVLMGDHVTQKMGVVDGSLSGFTPFGTLKTRRNRPFTGSEYWTVSAEHNFRTIPFELMGLKPLADRGWGVIIFGAAGYAESDNNSIMTPSDLTTNRIHIEAGISLNSIFGIMRIDVAKRLDAQGTFIGISVPRYF